MRLVSSLAALPLFTVLSFGVLVSAHADPLTLSIGVIQVGTGKPYPQFAYKSWVAEQLVTQTELIKANPKDALAYAKRAGFWKSTAITNELAADDLKFEQADADIKKAIELAPKDPQIYLFVARAVDTGEQRERAFQMALD